jgi:hypothetical protein
MKNIYFKIFTIFSFVLAIASCGSSGSGEGNEQSLKVSISPSKNIVEEKEGGELSFTITPNIPSTQLKCLSSVSWITEVAGKTNTWLVAANNSELSRIGKIYVLNKQTLAHIDTIQISQKSIYGQLDEESKYNFTETDVPIVVPFAGNTFITSSKRTDFIDNKSGEFTSDWDDTSIKSSTYFYVGATGELNLAMTASNSYGYGKIKVTANGTSHIVTIKKGSNPTIYSIDKIQIDKPQYVKVDLQGIEKESGTKSFANISNFRIGGAATTGNNNHFVTSDAYDSSTGYYFIRRGASVHWFYTMPTTADIEYFYNEVQVDKAENSSYYMMNGFTQGYMGIQQVSDGSHKVLFSVWSDSNDTKGTQPTIERQGSDVTFNTFDNEGSGRSCWLKFDWKEGQTYKALVKITPNSDNTTTFTGYFYDGTTWKLMAALKRPKLSTHYTGAYSFLENFDPVNSIYARQVLYKNQWVRTTGGEWKEITGVTFSCDTNGQKMWRYDYSGAVDDTNHGFILKSFGFSNDHTSYGTKFTRKAGGTKPNIDLEALEKL